MPYQNYSELIEDYFNRSNEKELVCSLLDRHFGERRFGAALDVGAGTGAITGPISERSKSLDLIELLPEFAKKLKQKFPKSNVIEGSVNDVLPDSNWDLILYSQGLYYQKVENWFPICQNLFSRLNEGGELVLILNRDYGDWWKFVKHFMPRYGEHMKFQYLPLSKFKTRLGDLSTVQAIPYAYEVDFEDREALLYYLSSTLLAIEDERVWEQIRPELEKMHEGTLMKYNSEILILEKKG